MHIPQHPPSLPLNKHQNKRLRGTASLFSHIHTRTQKTHCSFTMAVVPNPYEKAAGKMELHILERWKRQTYPIAIPVTASIPSPLQAGSLSLPLSLFFPLSLARQHPASTVTWLLSEPIRCLTCSEPALQWPVGGWPVSQLQLRPSAQLKLL